MILYRELKPKKWPKSRQLQQLKVSKKCLVFFRQKLISSHFLEGNGLENSDPEATTNVKFRLRAAKKTEPNHINIVGKGGNDSIPSAQAKKVVKKSTAAAAKGE